VSGKIPEGGDIGKVHQAELHAADQHQRRLALVVVGVEQRRNPDQSFVLVIGCDDE